MMLESPLHILIQNLLPNSYFNIQQGKYLPIHQMMPAHQQEMTIMTIPKRTATGQTFKTLSGTERLTIHDMEQAS